MKNCHHLIVEAAGLDDIQVERLHLVNIQNLDFLSQDISFDKFVEVVFQNVTVVSDFQFEVTSTTLTIENSSFLKQVLIEIQRNRGDSGRRLKLIYTLNNETFR